MCKHIWAAVLEADERNLLDGDGVLSEEAFLEADVGRANTRKRPDVPLPLQKPPTAPWQRFLPDLTQRLEAGERLSSNRRFADGEILMDPDFFHWPEWTQWGTKYDLQTGRAIIRGTYQH